LWADARSELEAALAELSQDHEQRALEGI